ncbi:hypothetical protein AB6A40_001014 [Gnathostoma spinigerum]|uniref:Uncharacterized protein n=1 Tax=Gnathostoma spinigerum TaxID=75299 RepID=A0ABD6E483_9BILA
MQKEVVAQAIRRTLQIVYKECMLPKLHEPSDDLQILDNGVHSTRSVRMTAAVRKAENVPNAMIGKLAQQISNFLKVVRTSSANMSKDRNVDRPKAMNEPMMDGRPALSVEKPSVAVVPPNSDGRFENKTRSLLSTNNNMTLREIPDEKKICCCTQTNKTKLK